MIYVEYTSIGVHPLLPALGQRSQIIFHASGLVWHWAGPSVSGIYPGGTTGSMIDEECPAIGSHLHGPAGRQCLFLAGSSLKDKNLEETLAITIGRKDTSHMQIF